MTPMNTDESDVNGIDALAYPCPSVTSVASSSLPLPAPRVAMRVRVGTLDDLPFMDALQKAHSKQLGFFPRAQMEGYLNAGHVLVAEEAASGERLGYVASRDRYLKRDELGVIYQLCVAEAGRRKLVAATLLRDVFARSLYGCRLYCCWCAQDLAANRFWEALGFQPIAFRTGSRTKGAKGKPRVHIFWQKRVRDDVTPWWYPSETGGGAIRENRLVLPIPIGVRWDEVMPVVLPGEGEAGGRLSSDASSSSASLPAPRKKGSEEKRDPAAASPSKTLALSRPAFEKPVEAPKPVEKKPREKRPAAKHDPALVRKARELRDRWFEHVNDGAIVAPAGKYALLAPAADESRQERTMIDVVPVKLLAA